VQVWKDAFALKQNLYILVFKSEPLFKIGLAKDTYLRAAALGRDRFDFKASYVVQAKDQRAIRTLEQNLKTFFAEHQVPPPKPLSSGNTETFSSSILPGLVDAIERFATMFPQGGYRIDRDLDSIVPQPVGEVSPPEHTFKRLRRKMSPLQNIQDNEDPLIDLTGAANYLKISNRALRDLCRRRVITHVRLDRLNWRFRRSALDAYLNRLTFKAKSVYD
jgi:excisionase family DNA binding protein